MVVVKILLKRGLEENRETFIPDIGEPLFTIDEQRFYIGDGITEGGILPSLYVKELKDVIVDFSYEKLINDHVSYDSNARYFLIHDSTSEDDWYNSLIDPSDLPYHIDATHLADGSMTNEELQSLVGISSRKILTGNGLLGGGDLTEDRTIVLGTPSTITPSTTNSVSSSSHTHAITGFAYEQHLLVGSNHIASGLTPGHFLKATSSTEFNFVEHGLTPTDIGAPPTSLSIIAGDGLTGGGDLTGDVTISLNTPDTITQTSVNSVTATSHTHAITGFSHDDHNHGTGIVNYLTKWEDTSGNLTSSNIYHNTDSVGIGTNIPLDVLHISSTSSTSLLVHTDTDTLNETSNIYFKVSTEDTDIHKKAAIFFERTNTYGRGSLHLAVDTVADSANVQLSDAKVTIDESGNVGINQPVPMYGLDVNGTARITADTLATTVPSHVMVQSNSNNILKWQTWSDFSANISTSIGLDDYLPLAGGTMSGNIDMGINDIINIKTLIIGDDIIHTDEILRANGDIHIDGKIRCEGDIFLNYDEDAGDGCIIFGSSTTNGNYIEPVGDSLEFNFGGTKLLRIDGNLNNLTTYGDLIHNKSKNIFNFVDYPNYIVQYSNITGRFNYTEYTDRIVVVNLGMTNWTSEPVTIKLHGMKYTYPDSTETSGRWELTVSGYNASGGSWYGGSAEIRGGAPFNRVRLGKNNVTGQLCLALGEIGDNWGITTFWLDEITIGYVSGTWADNAEIVFETDDITNYTWSYDNTQPQAKFSSGISVNGPADFNGELHSDEIISINKYSCKIVLESAYFATGNAVDLCIPVGTYYTNFKLISLRVGNSGISMDPGGYIEKHYSGRSYNNTLYDYVSKVVFNPTKEIYAGEITASDGLLKIPLTHTTASGRILAIYLDCFGDETFINAVKEAYFSDIYVLAWPGGQYETIPERLGIGLGTGVVPAYPLDVNGIIRTNNQIISTLATGTSPFDITSTTMNTNLNADMVDGYHASDLALVPSSGTTNYLTKWTGVNSLGNSVIYDNGTNVGIGTTDPSYLLDVNGSARITASVLSTTTPSHVMVQSGSDNVLKWQSWSDFSTNISTTIGLDDYLPLAGGTMSGDINMGGNDITNIMNLGNTSDGEYITFDGTNNDINFTAGGNTMLELQGDENQISFSPKSLYFNNSYFENHTFTSNVRKFSNIRSYYYGHTYSDKVFLIKFGVFSSGMANFATIKIKGRHGTVNSTASWWELIVDGYYYEYWRNPKACIYGISPFKQVRLGKITSTGELCLALGSIGDVFTTPMISLDELLITGNSPQNWAENVSFEWITNDTTDYTWDYDNTQAQANFSAGINALTHSNFSAETDGGSIVSFSASDRNFQIYGYPASYPTNPYMEKIMMFYATGTDTAYELFSRDHIRFNINEWGSTVGEIMRITPTGVGVKITSPAYPLDVNGIIRTNNQIISTLATGTKPFDVISTTMNTNLNADMVDGYHASDLALVPSSGTTNYLAKWTGVNSLGNSIIYDDGTNVGIGTTTPTAKLDVAGNVRIREENSVKFAGTGTDDSKFTIRYNSTSNTLDFRYVG